MENKKITHSEHFQYLIEKLLETETKSILLKHIFMIAHFPWLGIDTSIKSGRVKLIQVIPEMHHAH